MCVSEVLTCGYGFFVVILYILTNVVGIAIIVVVMNPKILDVVAKIAVADSLLKPCACSWLVFYVSDCDSGHNAETRERIRQRTIEALRDPKVKSSKSHSVFNLTNLLLQ